MSAGRLVLAWLVGAGVATVASVLGAIVTAVLAWSGSLALVITVQVLLGVVAVLVGVVAAVLLWSLRPDVAAAAPSWHWLVVGVPVVLVVGVIGTLLRRSMGVTTSGLLLVTVLLELLLGVGVALWLGTTRARAARASLDSPA